MQLLNLVVFSKGGATTMKRILSTFAIFMASILVSFAHEPEFTPEQEKALKEAFDALPVKSFGVLCGSNGAAPFATLASSNHPKFISNNIDDTNEKSERRNYRICNLTPAGPDNSASLGVLSTLQGDVTDTLARNNCIDILNAVEIKIYTGNSGKVSAGVYCQIP